MRDAPAGDGRLAHIDGMRGLAITSVMLFHGFARWPGVVPYGDSYLSFPLFHYGWLGVELFFLISGFVILMTLEKCDGFGAFLYRRWLRLWPAMLFCSALLFITAPLFLERPGGAPSWQSLLPGLTFVQQDLWARLLGDFPQLEGSFWSIFIEVKFYVIFGLLYFTAGRDRAILAIAAIAAVSSLLAWLSLPHVGVGKLINVANYTLGGQLFGWFAAGAVFYLYAIDRKASVLALAVCLALFSAATIPNATLYGKLAAVVVIALFTAALLLPGLRRLLAAPPLLFLGFASYPLYLLHENMMISIVVKLGAAMPWMWGPLLLVIAVAPILLAAWVVAKWVEPLLRAELRRLTYRRVNIPAAVRAQGSRLG